MPMGPVPSPGFLLEAGEEVRAESRCEGQAKVKKEHCCCQTEMEKG